MKILVIDGTGHVGRLVVDELARARSGRTRFPRAPSPPVRRPARQSQGGDRRADTLGDQPEGA